MLLTILIALFCLAGFVLLGMRWYFLTLNEGWNGWNWGKRLGFIAAGVAVIASPYVAFKTLELRFVLARVPDPLHVSWIEYRLEKSWGIGMPGDNETGFVVYRLTRGSSRWAREQGPGLVAYLPGGSEAWKPTPIADWDDEGRRWHPYDDQYPTRRHRPDVREYLDRYGFGIPVEQSRADEFNRAIRAPGSFYSYRRGGSITIVDPARGKVFFAYAG